MHATKRWFSGQMANYDRKIAAMPEVYAAASDDDLICIAEDAVNFPSLTAGWPKTAKKLRADAQNAYSLVRANEIAIAAAKRMFA